MKDENIFDTLMQHAHFKPEKIALYLLNPDDIYQVEQQISYNDLWNSVICLSEELKQHINEGDRVLLCYPTGIDFIVAFYACLLAKGIAVSVIVPNHAQLIKKFLNTYEDCQPKIILTDSKTSSLCQKVLENDRSPILATDTLKNQPGQITLSAIERPNIPVQSIAFLQYTSGSTASPKGVMITHENLIHNLKQIAKAFDSKPSSVGVNWLPHTHDMGLIGSFFHSVYMGATLYLMSPFAMLRRPLVWLEALAHYGATISGGPCFMLKMCLDHIKLNPEKIKDLNLQALDYLILGSEPIHHEIVHDFFETLAPYGLSPRAFAPAYGLAEATLMVSARSGLSQLKMALSPNAHAVSVVSCGHLYQTVKIVSTQTKQVCKEGEIGEIWIAGPSVTKGYWQKPVATQESFEALAVEPHPIYFKSGDLGFIKQNELFVVGRIKDIIVINGVNYYPEDIERSVLESDELLKDSACVVFRWQEEHAFVEQFVILIRAKKLVPAEQEELHLKIKKHLLKAYHLIPRDIQFVKFNFPKTTSGKLQRFACKSLYIENCIETTQRIVTC